MDDLRYGTVSGFAAAAAEAHRRRTSSARAAFLAVAVVVAMGGTSGLVGRSSSIDRIEPTVETPAPSATAAAARPSPEPPRPVGSPPATVPAAGAARPPADASPSPSVAAPPPQGADAPRPVAPQSLPVTRSQAEAMTCLPTSSCFDVGVPKSEGGTLVLTAYYCAADGRPLAFDENVEVSFEVTGWHRVLWTSLADHPPVPARHNVDVGTTECLRWTTRWRKTTNVGTALPKATYRLTAELRTATPSRARRSTYFEIG